jgi:hypothetical protein
MITRLKEMMPAPMAAPETPQLRVARLRIIACLMLVAVIVSAWAPLYALFGFPIVALLAGALGMLSVQVPIYLAIKSHADDAWLTECLEASRAREASNDA